MLNLLSARRKVAPLRDGNVHLFVCSFVCRQRVLVGQWPDWPSNAIVLAAVSAAGQVSPVPDMLMMVGAYRVGHSGRLTCFVYVVYLIWRQ